ncbi:uncharacterized protein B0H64DRAFT_445735 [Chaetomium fimeti]|uniref:Retrovirus-related Pol polyprotein from transposon TNT 1-94-like beta-barrel domain-containing protein n=1 Tax=Chaetomium fimeti TaxID=1854472 RepID=A0AAE0H836_9PEZI|nr:hypothetical protein B0H64DRAFT_445735 [Chaetomium fimeti]
MATPSATPELCPDWVLASGSNVHVARDRAWFSTYTPFPTSTTSYIVSNPMGALGVGDVRLPVKLFPKRSGPSAHGTLHLRNVLHAPNYICNVIGSPDTGDYSQIVLGGLGDNGKDAAITAENGRRLGYFVKGRRWVLLLSGPPVGPVVGPSKLDPDGYYMINAQWPASERQRWALAQGSQSGLGHNTNHGVSDSGEGNDESEAAQPELYTEAEKSWLKREWGGEFKFLTAHGLSIYKDEDREEGRRIARAMMGVDEDGDINM